LSINLQVATARSSERVLKSNNKKMSEKEQRIHPRRQVRWSVSILAANGLRRGETEDISLGGAFIRCEKPPRPNEKVLLTFEDWSSSMRVFAQVAWTNLASEDSKDKPTGMGVQFLQETSQLEWEFSSFSSLVLHDLQREQRLQTVISFSITIGTSLARSFSQQSQFQKEKFSIKRERLWLPKSRTGNTLECQSHWLLEWSLQ
jgi:Tfp pilus assembly protein PilZ